MADEFDTSENEELDEELEGEDPETSDDTSDDDEQEDEEDAPLTLDAVRELIAKETGAHAQTLRQLNTTVGRLQSIMDRQAKSPPKDDESVKLMQERYGEVSELLTLLVSGMDETVLSPEVRERIAAAQREAQRRADKEEILKEVREANKPPADDGPSTEDLLMEFQGEMEALIKQAGLDPDDELFDWSGAAVQALQRGGTTAARAYFIEQIGEGLKEKGAATRRDSRKKNAGKGSPKGQASGDKDPLSTGSLDDRLAALRALGAYGG